MTGAGPLTGGCACGHVRFRLETAPMFVHCCHCRDCQRQTGGGFVLNALIEADRVTLLANQPSPNRVPTDSGRPHDIHRCPACGVAVWSDYASPRIRFVRLGALDDPAALAPDVHIYTRSKLPWVALPAGARAFEAYCSAARIWPTASLERRRSILG